MAGFILMRVRQKRETRERRRLQLVDREQQYVHGENDQPTSHYCNCTVINLLISAYIYVSIYGQALA
jgi:hypothetical protein